MAFGTVDDILMFYHTAIRNVALFTSVSLALLGYSRFYRGKRRLYNISFIGLSLLFVISALMIGISLLVDIHDMINAQESTSGTDFTFTSKTVSFIAVPYILSSADVIIGIFGLYTLFREAKLAPP